MDEKKKIIYPKITKEEFDKTWDKLIKKHKIKSIDDFYNPGLFRKLTMNKELK